MASALSYGLDKLSMPRRVVWVIETSVAGLLLDASIVPIWWWHVDCICIARSLCSERKFDSPIQLSHAAVGDHC